GRPGGADPLDVRDTADWLDPILELDPAVVQQEVLKRRLKQPVAWRDWTPAQAPSGTTQVINYWNELNGSPGDYRLTMAAREKPIVLSREIKLSPSDNWLVVFANRYPSGGPAAKLEVRIGGEPVAEYEVPFRHRGNEDQPPLAISLANYRNAQKPIQVEIRQTATTHEGYVDWRSIQVVDQLPHLYQAFEDHGVFTAIDGDQKGIAKLITDDHHYGSHAVQVTPDGQFRLTFPKPIAIRERPQWGEYRHLRFAFRKVGEGRLALEVNRVGDALKPARYDAGAGEKVLESALRLWNDKLPNQWIVMTRDLYNDFGAFDATGLTITAPDGQQALFDHVYLARSNEDFKLIPNAPPPELTNQMARRDLAKPVLDRGFPAVVVIETNDGRFGSGVSLSQQGEILTAGHLLANANLPCTVHFADGRKVKAQTRGIYRDLDVGLIKVTDPGDYPFIERGNARDLPEQQLYVGFAHPLKLAAGVKPAAHIVGLRRVFRGMIWTDFDLPDYSSGGPLLNREAKLMGILAKRSEFGGFLFARLEDFDGQLGRLRNGEVYGAWYPGLGPMFGINVQSTRDGAKVLDVFPNSPAASANLKSGDIVTKVDGRAVVSLEDIYAVLGEKNAGQEAQIEYSRSGQAQQTKLLLVPRTP
ncbi:MAG TPA: S1C family serine protease, partial [Pirellulaceae bacterium]|nr:S1C family serine protease [Pirellulaceae bacterium]